MTKLCVTKLCVCVKKLCVCDKAGCERWSGTKLCVCVRVRDKVVCVKDVV